MTLVYLDAETVKRRIKKSTMRQVGLRFPLAELVLSPPSFPFGKAKVLITRILYTERGFPSDNVPFRFVISSRGE